MSKRKTKKGHGQRRDFRARDVHLLSVSLHTTAEVDIVLERDWRPHELRRPKIRLRIPACYARDLAMRIREVFEERERIATQDLATIKGHKT